MTKLSPTWTLLPLALACSTAEASRELLPTSLDTAVAALAADALTTRSPAPRERPPPLDTAYIGLRRSYSPADMRLHPCARLTDDGSIVGRACPAGVIMSGPRVVAPTHSDVSVRFEVEAAADVEVASEIVSDDARRVHGRVEEQRLSKGEGRVISHDVHVFEAAPAVECRIAVRGSGPIDLRISGLGVVVR